MATEHTDYSVKLVWTPPASTGGGVGWDAEQQQGIRGVLKNHCYAIAVMAMLHDVT